MQRTIGFSWFCNVNDTTAKRVVFQLFFIISGGYFNREILFGIRFWYQERIILQNQENRLFFA
jgi:hypothetical protein